MNILVPYRRRATLYRVDSDGGLLYMEAPRLITDFRIGASCVVGSIFPRTFGNDYWQTSYVVDITKIEDAPDEDQARIMFTTYRGSKYCLEVYRDSITYRDDLDDLIKDVKSGAEFPKLEAHKTFVEKRNAEIKKERAAEDAKYST